MSLPSFHYLFTITPCINFEVNYYRLGNNEHKYFSTSANQFNRSKTDYNHAGQAQKELLPAYSPAMKFYLKWDKMHLLDLSKAQHTEMLKDIEVLKLSYNSYYTGQDCGFSFEEEKVFSKNRITKSRLHLTK